MTSTPETYFAKLLVSVRILSNRMTYNKKRVDVLRAFLSDMGEKTRSGNGNGYHNGNKTYFRDALKSHLSANI